MKQVLEFSLGPISWSLANSDGSIYKSLGKEIPTMEEVPAKSSFIFDGLCVIQQLPKELDTFGSISEFILKRITSNNAKEVMFVTDQYFEASIKGGET